VSITLIFGRTRLAAVLAFDDHQLATIHRNFTAGDMIDADGYTETDSFLDLRGLVHFYINGTGTTVRELAANVGLPSGTVSDWLTKRHKISAMGADRLAFACRVRVVIGFCTLGHLAEAGGSSGGGPSRSL